MNRKLPYECIENSVKAKWDKAKKYLRINIDVKPKEQEKFDLPFSKVEYDGIDEDDIEDDPNAKSETKTGKQDTNANINNNFDSNIEVLDSQHFDEVKENDLIANSGQTLDENHTGTANDVL